ncbi:MAG: YfjI family protein, partial [Rhizobiaceae bacterium]
MVKITPEALDEFQRSNPWKPRPLRQEVRPEEYPVAYMPPVIAEAVREVQAYTQAPMAMVAACALSVVSAAVQTRYGVQRDAALDGPASLYLLTVAESGERKTAVDKLFMKPLREWEAQQMRAAREQKAQYETALEDWERDKESMENLIAQGFHADQLGTELDPRVQHELRKPKEPRLARMLRGDDTPEALSVALQNYPVAAVITSEAGVIFGSHGMSKESATRNLALVNAMWDGGPVSQDRIGRGSIHIERLRATMGLQVQPSVLQEFTRSTGGLARGIGYFARFLFSHPGSTRGTRYYTEPPADMPALRAFHARVFAMLEAPAEFDDFDRLVNYFLPMDQHARRVWVAFHDEVEEKMACDEEFSQIPDVASKAAEN